MIVAIVVQEGNNNKEQRAGAFLLVKGSFGLTTREPIHFYDQMHDLSCGRTKINWV